MRKIMVCDKCGGVYCDEHRVPVFVFKRAKTGEKVALCAECICDFGKNGNSAEWKEFLGR